ncbi:hypothetical protein LP419_07495 [Massilia sp. H-1]|nr:hypothetical protein LP419_07495 [Massilia sp. H-1]
MRKHFGQSLRIGVAPGALALATAAWLGRQGSAHRRRTGHRQRRSRRHRSHRLGLRQLLADIGCSNWVSHGGAGRRAGAPVASGAAARLARLADLEGAARCAFRPCTASLSNGLENFG